MLIHSLLVKILTLVEMEEWKKKGICYNYDEKFTSGHHCATQKLYVLDAKSPKDPSDEAFEDIMEDIEEETDQPNEVVPEISCNALYVFKSPQMIKVKRYFKGQILIILLDSRSTHNFVDLNVRRGVGELWRSYVLEFHPLLKRAFVARCSPHWVN